MIPDPSISRPLFANVRENLARFAKKAFGSATEMRITERVEDYLIEVHSEGHPVQDDSYVQYVARQWRRFLKNGFGPAAQVHLHTQLLAGSAGDGCPADQWIILPALETHSWQMPSTTPSNKTY